MVYHAGAGVTSMPITAFLFALVPAALVRSATYTWFGSTLVAGEAWEIVAAAGLLLALTVLPLIHPGGRSWLLTRLSRAGARVEGKTEEKAAASRPGAAD